MVLPPYLNPFELLNPQDHLDLDDLDSEDLAGD